MSIYNIHLRVTIMRQRLEEMVERYGRSDPRVLALSQRLDKLIAKLHRCG